MKTLILCTANVCRSPTAEALWYASAVRRGVIQPVSSAGFLASPGQRIHPWFASRLAREGVDMGGHRSTRYTRALVSRADLVLVMERSQLRFLQGVAPELAGRVQLLGRWTVGEIRDPIGRPEAEFEATYYEIRDAVERWFDRLVHGTEGRTSSAPERRRANA